MTKKIASLGAAIVALHMKSSWSKSEVYNSFSNDKKGNFVKNELKKKKFNVIFLMKKIDQQLIKTPLYHHHTDF